MTGTITVFNSAGNTTTAVATDLVRPSDWNSVHNITMNIVGSDLTNAIYMGAGMSSTTTTGAGAITIGDKQINFFEPFVLPNTNSTLSGPNIGSWYFEPFNLPFQLAGGALRLFMSNTSPFGIGAALSATSTGSFSRIGTFWNNVAVYKRDAGANSTRLASIWAGANIMYATQTMSINGTVSSQVSVSNALTLSIITAVDANGGTTYGSYSTSGTSSSGSSTVVSTFPNNIISNVVAYVSGARMDVLGMNSTLDPGQYWIAHCQSTNTVATSATYGGNGAMFVQHSVIGILENQLNAYKMNGSSVSSSNSNAIPFKGILRTASSGATSAAANSDLNYTTGRIYWNYDGSPFP